MKTIGKEINAPYLIKSAIGLAIMAFFRFIPAPAPITSVGMAMLGIFIGLIFLWSAVDTVWPTFAGILFFGPIALQIYPAGTGTTGVAEAIIRSIGTPFVFDLFLLFVFCYALNETGVTKRITYWLLTRKKAQKNPWHFTYIFFVAFAVVGLLGEALPMNVLLLSMLKPIYKALGMNPEDRWAKHVTAGACITSIIMNVATPFCHSTPILFMGYYATLTETPINWAKYIIIAAPAVVVIELGMLVYLRFFAKLDVSKLRTADFEALDLMRAQQGKMEAREKATMILTVLLFTVWIVPSIVTLFANGPIAQALSFFNTENTLILIIMALAIIHINKKPLVNIGEALQKSSIGTIFFVAGILMAASAVCAPPTGITEAVTLVLTPVIENVSPFMFIFIIAAVSIILTNFASNITVGFLMSAVAVPLAVQFGMDPFLVSVVVTVGATCAFAMPSANAAIGLSFSDPYGGFKTTCKLGTIVAAISVVVCPVMIYLVGNLVL